jgi:type VI secretion system Hcp family effector
MNKLILSVLGIGLLSLGVAHAQSFVKFEGVDGEVKVPGYENWCEFTSVVQQLKPGVTNSGFSKGGDPEFQDLVIVKPLDKASPQIVRNALIGSAFPKVEIEWSRNTDEGPVPHYRYELGNVLIKEYTSKGLYESQDSGERIMEQISLDFEAITVTYWEYNDEGELVDQVEYTWGW